MSLGSRRPSFKPTPYGSSRRRRGLPRWLLLLITGTIIGAGSVLFLQRSYGPQRLTVEQSEQMRLELNTIKLENQRLLTESRKIEEEIKAARADQQSQTERATEAREQTLQMQDSVATLLAAIAPDPRGGTPGIRHAEMTTSEEQLNYHILLIQDLASDQETAPQLRGEVRLVAQGVWRNGNAGHMDLATIPLEMGLYTTLNGSAEVQKAFQVRQVTIQVVLQGSDKISSTRTYKTTAAR